MIIKQGDIFEVRLLEGLYAYFQYISKDSCLLSSDVIRIFKKQHESRPSIDIIISDSVDCHLHTSIKAGINKHLWSKIGNGAIIGGVDLRFRDSNDYGKYPNQVIASKDWVVWELNGVRKEVGDLPKDYYTADIGVITPPEHVVFRISKKNCSENIVSDRIECLLTNCHWHRA